MTMKWNWWKSRIIFFRENEHLVYVFIYFLSKSHYGDKYSKTTIARNLKFRQIISPYMKLRPSNFWGTTSRDLGQMQPKMWQWSLLSAFSHVRVHAVVADWLKAPVLETYVRPAFNDLFGHYFYQTKIILNQAY